MSDENVQKNTKEELFVILDEMIESYSHMPRDAMIQPITHWEHESMLVLMRAILRSS
jgi:hypothetical protein